MGKFWELLEVVGTQCSKELLLGVSYRFIQANVTLCKSIDIDIR